MHANTHTHTHTAALQAYPVAKGHFAHEVMPRLLYLMHHIPANCHVLAAVNGFVQVTVSNNDSVCLVTVRCLHRPCINRPLLNPAFQRARTAVFELAAQGAIEPCAAVGWRRTRLLCLHPVRRQ